MTEFYKLIEDDPETYTPVPVNDPQQKREWEYWWDAKDRKVKATDVTPTCKVSTVFLGVDVSTDPAVKLLWHTRIFGGPEDSKEWFAINRTEAQNQHEDAVQLARDKGGVTAVESMKKRRRNAPWAM